jgi:hypothetical protein
MIRAIARNVIVGESGEPSYPGRGSTKSIQPFLNVMLIFLVIGPGKRFSMVDLGYHGEPFTWSTRLH